MPRRFARRFPLWLALLSACSARVEERGSEASAAASAIASAPSTVELSLPGVKVQTPAAFIALEPERVDRLRHSAMREDPHGSVQLEARRAPEKISDGMVYVMHGEQPRPGGAPITVRKFLDDLSAEMKANLLAVGMELKSFEAVPKDDALETCIRGRAGSGDQSMEVRTCTRMYAVGGDRIHSLVVHCMAKEQLAEAVCGPVLASRSFEPVQRLPFDRELGATGAAPVEPHHH